MRRLTKLRLPFALAAGSWQDGYSLPVLTCLSVIVLTARPGAFAKVIRYRRLAR
jgi:hypothetical protein